MSIGNMVVRRWVCLGILVVFGGALVGLKGFFSEEEKLALGTQYVNSEVCCLDKKDAIIVYDTVKSGDSADSIIWVYTNANTVQQVLKAAKGVYALKKIRVGQQYKIVYYPESSDLELFEYEVDDKVKLVVKRFGNVLKAHMEEIQYDYKLVHIVGSIKKSLFDSLAEAGESPCLVADLVDIFSSEIDFIRDVRCGDSFGILVEKKFKAGKFKGYGRIIGATFTNKGTVHEGYRFKCNKGYEQYYTATGENLHRAFLKAPLAFTRVSSGYSLSRRHPIYFDKRPHLGIDYAAPVGTPVKSIGDGEIKKVGWGVGFGKMVIVRHKNGVESVYSHLSSFAAHSKNGAKVKRGEVIGYVGATGVATGPHLDFRIKKDGNYINPVKLINPRAKSISSDMLLEYKKKVSMIKSYMEMPQEVVGYNPQDLL